MFKKFLFGLVTICATLSATPKAVVFDFGGVLTTEPNKEAVINFLRSTFFLSAEEFEIVNQEKRKSVQAGMTDEEFWLQYAKNEGIFLPEGWVNSFRQVMKDAIGINHEMFAVVGEIKLRGIQVALLSNIDERLAKLIRSFGLYESFQPCILSYEVGLEKPDIKIFEYLLRELDLPPSEVVFIDDLEENVQAAHKVGIDAIQFTDREDLEKELEKRDVNLKVSHYLSPLRVHLDV